MLYDPAGQGDGGCTVDGHSDPAGHVTHAAADEYVPDPHTELTSPPEHSEPLGHAMQPVAPMVAYVGPIAVTKPLGQLAWAPSEAVVEVQYLPVGHCVHCVEPAGAKDPAGHGTCAPMP